MEDTIAAISTSTVSSGGISVVRISGENALSVAQQVFRSKKNKNVEDMESHTVHYGNIYNGEELIDEVLMVVMKAPNTYTREDVVEIDCHGGILVTKKVLEAVLSAGARLAEPGEFTKRAFLNGRIDLSQAEAVIDVIQSKNEYALKSSVRQLSGKLSEKIKGLRELVLNNVAYIEAALDDPEHISLDNYVNKLSIDVDKCVDNVDNLLKTCDNGRIAKEGIRTVILDSTSSLVISGFFSVAGATAGSSFFASSWNTSATTSSSKMSLSFFLRTRMTAGLLNNPKIPELPFSTTSTSTLSLVVSSFTSASVKASSTVFPEISI